MRNIIFSAIILIIMSNMIWACPANPNSTHSVNVNGKMMLLHEWGDEFAHGYETLDGYTIIKNNGIWYYATSNNEGKLKTTSFIVTRDNPVISKIDKHVRPSIDYIMKMRESMLGKKPENLKAKNVKYEGDWNVLVILIDFPDHPHTFSKEEFQDLLFSENPDNPRSMTDYYKEVSYGKFHVVGDVVGWYTAKNEEAYYGPDKEQGQIFGVNVRELVDEAVKAADPLVDFSKYDNDKDGVVESVNIFYAGYREDDYANWPHMGGSDYTTEDGLKILLYTIQSEQEYDEITGIGIFVHEFAHTIGLPDLYDPKGITSGLGSFDPMSNGAWISANGKRGDCPSHFTAWCKNHLGWLSYTEITGPGNYGIASYEYNQDCFKIRGAMPDSEYFLVENRQKIGFDRALPGETGGILVWHIDEDYYLNNDRIKMIDLEQAQPLQTLDLPRDDPMTSNGSDEDYFRKGKEFTDTTEPDSRSDLLIDSGVSLVNFEKKDETGLYSFYAALKGNRNIALQWTFETENESGFYGNVHLSPDGSIYSSSRDGKLYALKADGSLKWSRSITNTILEKYFTAGPDGTIYAAENGEEDRLLAINADGSQKWELPFSNSIMTEPVINNTGIVYFVSQNNCLNAVDSEGTIIWSTYLGEGLNSTELAISPDGTIYITSGTVDLSKCILFAVSPDGSKKWSLDFPDVEKMAKAAFDNDGLIYLTIQLSSRTEIYTINLNGFYTKFLKIEGEKFDAPTIIDSKGTIYFAGNRNGIYAFNPDSTLKWQYDWYKESKFVSLTMGLDGSLLTASENGLLLVFQNDGKLLWNFSVFEKGRRCNLTTPAISRDGRIYIGSSAISKGRFYALKNQNEFDFVLHTEPTQNKYSFGDKIQLILDLYTPTSSTNVDIYFALLNNTSGKIFFGMDWVQSASPLLQNLTLPQDQAYYNISIMTLTLPVKIPPICVPGQYTFAIAATDAGTIIPKSNVATATFELN